MRLELLANVVVTVCRALRVKFAEQFRSLRQVVVRDQLPSRAGVHPSFGRAQIAWLEIPLFRANPGYATLYRIEVFPPFLAQETQPEIENCCPDSFAPVVRRSR